MSLFCAGWTLGSFKNLAEAGVAGITYFETTGKLGIMEGAQASQKFYQSLPGGVFPVYHVLADIGEFANGKVIPAMSNAPNMYDGLVLEEQGDKRIILVNYTPNKLTLSARNLPAQIWIRVLDETNVESAISKPEDFRMSSREIQNTHNGVLPLVMNPFAIVRIDYN
jgi:hypothetical protein